MLRAKSKLRSFMGIGAFIGTFEGLNHYSETFQNIPKNRKKDSNSLCFIGKWVVANEAPEALPQGFFYFFLVFFCNFSYFSNFF